MRFSVALSFLVLTSQFDCAIAQEVFVARGFSVSVPAVWGASRTLGQVPLFPDWTRPDTEFNHRIYTISGKTSREDSSLKIVWQANETFAARKGDSKSSAKEHFKRFIDDNVYSLKRWEYKNIKEKRLPKINPCCYPYLATATKEYKLVNGEEMQFRTIVIAVLRHDGLATAEIGGPIDQLNEINIDAFVSDLVSNMSSDADAGQSK